MYLLIAVCCSVCRVLQCVAVCSSVLQHVAVCCNVVTSIRIVVLRSCHKVLLNPMYVIIAVCCSVLQCVAVCCSVLQRVALCCRLLQGVATCCSVLQCRQIDPNSSVLWLSQSVVEPDVCDDCCVLQCVAGCSSVLPCVAVCRVRCNVLQCVAISSHRSE